MTRGKKILIGGIVLVLVGAGAMAMIGRKDKDLVEVDVQKVERADLVSKVSATGAIEAKRKVDLSANVMGQIVNLAVREGDTVAKGDFLLQIDKTQLAASAEGASASLRAFSHDRAAAAATALEAERNYERARKSFDDKLIPQSELDRARTALDSARSNVAASQGRIEQARANVAGARDTLSKTTIRAPMAGVVTALPVEEGEVAVIGTMNNPGTVLMTISDMSLVEAVMEVDETDIPNVRIGQKATVTVDAYSDQQLTGTVTEVGSSPMASGASAGSEAVNFEVRVQLDAPPAGIRPGFSCSADIVTGTKNGAVAVPIQALVVREKKAPGDKGEKESPAPAAASGPGREEEGVYLVEGKENKVKFTPVVTGITGATSIEIASGLAPGAEIVIGPFKALRELEDGKKIKRSGEGKDKKGKGKDGKGESRS